MLFLSQLAGVTGKQWTLFFPNSPKLRVMSSLASLAWLYLSLLISSRNTVEEIFLSFLRIPVSENVASQRLGFGFSFVCEEVLFIINSVVYGFITRQFMWIFSKTLIKGTKLVQLLLLSVFSHLSHFLLR